MELQVANQRLQEALEVTPDLFSGHRVTKVCRLLGGNGEQDVQWPTGHCSESVSSPGQGFSKPPL